MNPVATLRHRLGLSQPEFARVYRIPLTSLLRWEHGTNQPTGAAQTLLLAIDREPGLMRDVLA